MFNKRKREREKERERERERKNDAIENNDDECTSIVK
jgi:hypothetical protein